MQRLVPATIAFAVLLAATLAVGADPIPDSDYPQTQVYYHRQPAGTPQTQPYYYNQTQPRYYAPPQPARQTFFQRMMDLERRKNQAILRFFRLR